MCYLNTYRFVFIHIVTWSYHIVNELILFSLDNKINMSHFCMEGADNLRS